MSAPPAEFYQLCRLCLSSASDEGPAEDPHRLFTRKCLQVVDNTNANANGVIIAGGDSNDESTKVTNGEKATRSREEEVREGGDKTGAAAAGEQSIISLSLNEKTRADGLEGKETKNSTDGVVVSPLSSSSAAAAASSSSSSAAESSSDKSAAEAGLSVSGPGPSEKEQEEEKIGGGGATETENEKETKTTVEATAIDDCKTTVKFMRNESSTVVVDAAKESTELAATTTTTTSEGEPEKEKGSADSLFLLDNNKSAAAVDAGDVTAAEQAAQESDYDNGEFGELPQRILTCLAIKVGVREGEGIN